MKSVLISIKPKWCELIASGKKTIEVRKTRPKIETPFMCYIYCTMCDPTFFLFNGKIFKSRKTDIDIYNRNAVMNGKVIGEFICDGIYKAISHPSALVGQPCYDKTVLDESCVTAEQARKYSKGKDLYGWHISDLVIYDEPKELNDFYHFGGLRYDNVNRPPQSWCYVDELL